MGVARARGTVVMVRREGKVSRVRIRGSLVRGQTEQQHGLRVGCLRVGIATYRLSPSDVLLTEARFVRDRAGEGRGGVPNRNQCQLYHQRRTIVTGPGHVSEPPYLLRPKWLPPNAVLSVETQLPRLHEPVVRADHTVQPAPHRSSARPGPAPRPFPPLPLSVVRFFFLFFFLFVGFARYSTAAAARSATRGAQEHARKRTYRRIRQQSRAKLEAAYQGPPTARSTPGSGPCPTSSPSPSPSLTTRPTRRDLPHPHLAPAPRRHDPLARSRPRRRRRPEQVGRGCGGGGGEWEGLPW